MKKLGVIIGVIFCLLLISLRVQAEETVDNLYIYGLDEIKREYEAGTNPASVNFTEGLGLYDNLGTLAPDKLLVDYGNVRFDEVGTYQIDYYILYIVDGHEVRFKVTSIEIDIVDTTSPKLKGVQPILVKLGRRDPIDYLSGITVTDNDKSSLLDIKVFDQTVDVNKIGVYRVMYFVTDKSGNHDAQETYVIVQNFKYDQYEPEITLEKEVYHINVNSQHVDYLSYVSATDGNKDMTSYVQYDDSDVDYTTIGTYKVYFAVYDGDGNIATAEASVNIVEDNEPPYFVDLEDGDTIDWTIHRSDIYKSIKAEDAVCGDVTERISFEFFDFNTEGTYNVTFTVTDLNGNNHSIDVNVHVYDNLAPEITAPKSLYIKLGENLDLAGKILVEDNVDETVNFSINASTLNPNKVGTYIVDISATDNKGNTSIEKMTVYVYDPDGEKIYKNPIVIGSTVAIMVSAFVAIIGYNVTKRKR